MTNQRAIAREVLARDAIQATTKVIESSATCATIGWDDQYSLCWVECPACGTDKFFTEDVDLAICTKARHNQKQHGYFITGTEQR